MTDRPIHRRKGLSQKVAALADGTRSFQDIATTIDADPAYVRKAVERLGLRDKITNVRAYSTKLLARRRLDLLRRAHDVIVRQDPDGAVWAQLIADMKQEIDNG